MQWQSPSPCQCFRRLHSTFLQKILRTENSKTGFATKFSQENTLFCSEPEKAAKSSFPEYRQREQNPSNKETGLVYAGIEATRRETFVVIFGGNAVLLPIEQLEIVHKDSLMNRVYCKVIKGVA